ncbi:cytochrome b/b6 domain-containing protein [Cytobacillus spongiae]|uniref:formate dehydrogenase subunit gamma n=1 Tax=Cytobacillus spongiae TaxID=2901381 RepID=UPI001F1C78D5|nr:cytochrome b/b6 domain-containing protein [Cytobacillus spongiae]UII55811.1 cytochrome b/b6 domain-containing protein [Cytobacillus spongiae]
MNKGNQKMVKRFSKPVIIAHWLNAFAFFTLYISGLPMYTEYFDWVYSIFGGPAGARLAHRVGAVLFVIPVLFILIADPKSFFHWIKEILTWKKSDIKFFKEFPKEFFGGHADIPKQGFYNAGEKVNSFLTIITAIMLIGSGFIMWFPQFFSQGIIMWAYPIHNIGLGLSLAVVVGHIYLSVGHPNSRPAFRGITKGEVPAEYAKEHHGLWYEELEKQEKEIEKKRA